MISTSLRCCLVTLLAVLGILATTLCASPAKTEPAYSGAYLDFSEPGSYLCADCGSRLFSSESKFDAGSGWPSFSEAEPAVAFAGLDPSGIPQRELSCSACGAHLGHAFADGRPASGLCCCVNSCSLRFVPSDLPDSSK